MVKQINVKLLLNTKALFYRYIILILLFTQPSLLLAQAVTNRVAVPFLLINPDARSTGMGDAGVATSADIAALSLNPAKYAFINDKAGVAITITPWMRKLVKDQNLIYLSGFYKTKDRETIAASLKFFSLGKIYFSDEFGINTGEYTANEFAVDVAYIRQLFDNFSLSTTFNYIHSGLRAADLNNGNANKGNSVAVEIGAFYTKNLNIDNFSIGLHLSNVGPKMLYGTEKLPLPTNLCLGFAYNFIIPNETNFTLTTDVNRFLIKGTDNTGMFSLSTGAELEFHKTFSLRTGYHQQTNQNYFTAGMGLKYRKLNINFSYLLGTSKYLPIQNTMRYGLAYAIQ